MTAQRSVLFTFRVLLITRVATRYLQHKVHLPKSLPHVCRYVWQGTPSSNLNPCETTLVTTTGPEDSHCENIQDPETVSGARTNIALGGSHFSVIVSCKCVRAVLWHCSLVAATRSCGSLRRFPCGLLRGTPETASYIYASRREESEIIHRQPTAKR